MYHLTFGEIANCIDRYKTGQSAFPNKRLLDLLFPENSLDIGLIDKLRNHSSGIPPSCTEWKNKMSTSQWMDHLQDVSQQIIKEAFTPQDLVYFVQSLWTLLSEEERIQPGDYVDPNLMYTKKAVLSMKEIAPAWFLSLLLYWTIQDGANTKYKKSIRKDPAFFTQVESRDYPFRLALSEPILDSMALSPAKPPIQVLPMGRDFRFDVTLTNTGSAVWRHRKLVCRTARDRWACPAKCGPMEYDLPEVPPGRSCPCTILGNTDYVEGRSTFIWHLEDEEGHILFPDQPIQCTVICRME